MRLFLSICLASIAAHASFSVKPTLITMDAGKGKYNGWIEISHSSGNFPHAVEFSINERELDLDGEVKTDLAPAKDFVIYPSNVLLLPGRSMNVQILYKGPKIKEDRGYVLNVKEIPQPEGQKETILSIGLAIKVNYNVGILMDTGKRSALTFVSSQALDSGKVEVIMENKSKGRFSFTNKNLYANGKKTLAFNEGINSVMPGQQRRFVFDYHKPLTAKEVYFGK